MLRGEKIIFLLKNETAKSSEIRLANTYIPSRDVFSEVSVLSKVNQFTHIPHRFQRELSKGFLYHSNITNEILNFNL